MLIAITRLREKSGKDNEMCGKYGHECRIVSPMKAELYPENIRNFVDKANSGAFDCIFFTSALPAQSVTPLLDDTGRKARIVAIGPQTAKTVESFGVKCETLTSFYSNEFTSYLGDWIKGKNIGIPRADVPNPHLISGIQDAGGNVFETPIYALIASNEPLDLSGGDVILFTSANSFTYSVWDRSKPIIAAAIGEVTAKRMKDDGVMPTVIGDGSLEGTLKALNSVYGN